MNMQFKSSEKVQASTNTYTFIMTHREEVARYMEQLEVEREKRQREAYERKLIEKMRKQMEQSNGFEHSSVKKEGEIFYFDDVY